MAGIYIHIPFCKQACHYCNFHFSTSLGKKSEMVDAIKHELFLRKNEIPNIKIETIYFGGGTPSLLSIDELESLIEEVYKNYDVVGNPEITLEANPDDLIKTTNRSVEALTQKDDSRTDVHERSSAISGNLFEKYRNAGINRLSIGVQSFFEQDLKLMNRAHDADEARHCLDEATSYFDNISIDLIYGIQGMSNQRWEENIDIALSYKLPHISSYALTVEPKTAMANSIKKGKIPNVSEAQCQEQFNILLNKLNAEGFINYEISNFGKKGYFSKNNTSYWQEKPYLGIGPSAHSFDGQSRSWNVANNALYLKSLNNDKLPREIEVLSLQDKFNEYIMTGLRTIWGVSMSKIEENFGKPYQENLLANSKKYIDKGFLRWEENKENNKDQILVATQKGKFLIDGIASDLFILN